MLYNFCKNNVLPFIFITALLLATDVQSFIKINSKSFRIVSVFQKTITNSIHFVDGPSNIFLIDSSDCTVNLDQKNKLPISYYNQSYSLLVASEDCDFLDQIADSLGNLFVLDNIKAVFFVSKDKDHELGLPYHRPYLQQPIVSTSTLFSEISASSFKEIKKMMEDQNSTSILADIYKEINLFDELFVSRYFVTQETIVWGIRVFICLTAFFKMIHLLVQKIYTTKVKNVCFVVLPLLMIQCISGIPYFALVPRPPLTMAFVYLRYIASKINYMIISVKWAKLITSYHYSQYFSYILGCAMFIGSLYIGTYLVIVVDGFSLVDIPKQWVDTITYVLPCLVLMYSVCFGYLLYMFQDIINIVKINNEYRKELKRISVYMMLYTVVWIVYISFRLVTLFTPNNAVHYYLTQIIVFHLFKIFLSAIMLLMFFMTKFFRLKNRPNLQKTLKHKTSIEMSS